MNYTYINNGGYPRFGANGNPAPINPGIIYGAVPGQRPIHKDNQPLTPEQINYLKNNNENIKIKMEINSDDLLGSKCTHKENLNSTLIQVGVSDEGNPIVRCNICGEVFELRDVSNEEVEKHVKIMIDLLQSCKTMYLDAPTSLTEAYYQLIPLLKKFPQLYAIAVKNFNSYANATENQYIPQYAASGTNGFMMYDAMIHNANPGGYGYGSYQQPGYQAGYYQPSPSPYQGYAGYQQPVYQPNYQAYQPVQQPGYQASYQQPVQQPVYQPSYQQPAQQSAQQPNQQWQQGNPQAPSYNIPINAGAQAAAPNPFGYGQPGVIPNTPINPTTVAQNTAAPVISPAGSPIAPSSADSAEVTQTKQFNV